MVVYILYCKADMEGIATLTLNPNANLCFSVRNSQDALEVREKIVVDPSVLHNSAISDHGKHRDETPSHFAMKFNNTNDGTSRATLRILGAESELLNHINPNTKDEDKSNRKSKKKGDKMSVELDKALASVRSMTGDETSFVPMLALDCNGLEPYAFHPLGADGDDGEFVAVGKGGKTYTTVDLSDGDWSDYDLSTGSVSITNFESKLE